MNLNDNATKVLAALATVFVGLTAAFWLEPYGRTHAPEPIPLVDTNFLSTATVRQSYAELIRLKADLSDFDCYACHEKGKPPPLRFDTNQVIIIPKEHANIVMGHGSHNRNNNCFNCHDELNLEQFQTRDGRALKLDDSTHLCGSCHGPTFRDWEGGAHGRTGGFWNKASGETTRRDCVECHNPHSPHLPGRPPAPGPHPLREPPIHTPKHALRLPSENERRELFVTQRFWYSDESLSPRPSPAGRGSPLGRHSTNLQCADSRACGRRFSLSQQERAGVRESATRNLARSFVVHPAGGRCS